MSRIDSKQQQNSSDEDLKEPVICESCKKPYGSNEGCDWCKDFLIQIAIGGGKARSDVVPLQLVHDSSNKELCVECNKPLGSNTQACAFCASLAESSLNQAQPVIPYDPHFGPMSNSFGPCTDETTRATLESFRKSFEAAKKNGHPFIGITDFKMGTSRLRELLSSGVIIGFEGFNNSCFWISVFWILSQGNMHERINTDCLSGHILYKIVWDLRSRLFVGRDIVEAFRLSLQEYPDVRRTLTQTGMDDPNCGLVILEEVGILRKGPSLSLTGCSFHIHEVLGGNPAQTIQEALYTSVTHHSPVPDDGSIVSFQFCQQRGRNGRFMGQTLGTDFGFPHNGVVLVGKLLKVRMFIIFTSQHYLVVLCVGEAFFLSNSLSASQCGHFLPETREISEEEAMRLFRTQAHTIVFECVGDVPPPPLPCEQGHWVPPLPQHVHCVQDPWVPPPPPPAPSAQQTSQQFDNPCVVWFVDQYRLYDPEQKVLRSTMTGSIIDDIRAGTYRVEEKGTHKMIDIELREVPSDDTPPPQQSITQFARAPKTSPASSQKISITDISVSGKKWSCNGTEFSGKVEKTPHPQYPQFLIEVYYYETVKHTTLQELVGFLNFIKSIQ